MNIATLDANVMRRFVDSLLRGDVNSVDIKQWSIRIDPESRELKNVLSLKRFANKELTKRLVMPQNLQDGGARLRYRTLPYGYCHELLKFMLRLEEAEPL